MPSVSSVSNACRKRINGQAYFSVTKVSSMDFAASGYSGTGKSVWAEKFKVEEGAASTVATISACSTPISASNWISP